MPEHEIRYAISGRTSDAGKTSRKYYLFISTAIIVIILALFMLIARIAILGLMRRSGKLRSVFRKDLHREDIHLSDMPEIALERFRIITAVRHSHK